MIDLALNDRVYIDDNLDEAIQELDILFNSESTELINDINFGSNFNQFLWTLTPMTDSIRQYVSEKLKDCKYLQLFNYNFDVVYYNEEYKSMYHLIINIYINDNKTIKKEYDFR